MVTMHVRFRFLLAAAAANSMSAGLGLPSIASADPEWVAPGPAGGCPAGYHLGSHDRHCWRDGGHSGRKWIPTGPDGGCPPGYHPGTHDRRCWRND
jgi:hypothetical protein